MKIGIDIRPLQRETRFRGIGKYLEHLLLAMAKLPDEHHLVFYAEGGLPLPKNVIDAFRDKEVILLPAYRLSRIRFVRAFAPPSRIIKPANDEVDVMFVADATVGMPDFNPTVAAFHDAIPLLFQDKEVIEQSRGWRKLKRQLASALYWRKYQAFLNSFTRIDHIVPISEQSARDLHKYVPGTKDIPYDVIYLGALPLTTAGKKPQLPKGLSSQDKFLLYVGGIDLRKNIAGLARDYVEVHRTHPDLKLVVVGKEFGLKDQLADYGWFKPFESVKYNDCVVAPGYVDDASLALLYEKAEAFVLPSLYEGFGLPVLEAMQAGCPVVMYDNSSLPEVAGDATLMVKNGAPMASAINRLLSDNKLREQLIRDGKVQAKKFSWDKSARATLDVLVKTAESNDGK